MEYRQRHQAIRRWSKALGLALALIALFPQTTEAAGKASTKTSATINQSPKSPSKKFKPSVAKPSKINKSTTTKNNKTTKSGTQKGKKTQLSASPSQSRSSTQEKTVTAKSSEKQPTSKSAITKNSATNNTSDTGKKSLSAKTTPPEPKKTPDQEVDEFESTADDKDDDEPSTSPLLYVFVLFILGCVTGYLYLKKNQEVKRNNIDPKEFVSVHGEEFSSDLSSLSNDYRRGKEPGASAKKSGEKNTTLKHPKVVESNTDSAKPTTTKSFSDQRKSEEAEALPPYQAQKSPRTDRPPLPEVSPDPSQAQQLPPLQSKPIDDDLMTHVGLIPQNSKPEISTSEKNSLPVTSTTALTLTEPKEPCSFEKFVEIREAQLVWQQQQKDVPSLLYLTFQITSNEWQTIDTFWNQCLLTNPQYRDANEEMTSRYREKYLKAS